MKGYLIANLDIHDQSTFERYREEVVPLIARYGGRYLVRGGEVENLEGDLGAKRLVVLEFPTMDAAREFYHSAEYRPVLDLRLRSAASDVLLVAGYDA